VTKAENCLGLLCDEIDILGDADSVENSLAPNYLTYKKLATSSALPTGRAAQQRTIRIELRRVRPTTGNFCVSHPILAGHFLSWSRWLTSCNTATNNRPGKRYISDGCACRK